MIAPGIGGAIGFLAGTLLGNLLDPPKIEGPRLNDLKLQTSEYGRPIPIIYGTVRLSGNVIWQTDLEEHKNVEGGKGGPEVTSYTYSASFAVMICAGPIDGIIKIFADGRLVWDEEDGGSASGTFDFTLYTGTETQEPDPTMEAEIGVGLVPAHRGYAYVVFDDLMLADFGNRIPQLEFVVSTEPPAAGLRIVKSNYDTGADTGVDSAYNYAGSPTLPVPQWFSGMPILVDWPRSGDIIVAKNTLNAGHIVAPPGPHAFSRDDLSCTNTAASTSLQFPSFDNASTHLGIGIHVLADGNEIALWHTDSPSSDIGTDVQVYAASVATPDIPAYTNFLVDAGVTSTEYLCGSAITQDGLKFFAFTSPTSSGSNATKWYRIEDATVVETGTVSSSFASAWGNNAKPHGVGNPNERNGKVVSVENNGRYFWYSDAQGAGEAEIYYIDDNGDFADWGNGSLSLGIDNHDGVEHTIQTLHVDGYAGFFRGNSLLLLSRVGARPGVPLSEIVADISSRTPLAVSEYDTTALTDIVPGYTIPAQMEARNAIHPLRQAYFFDGVEVDGVVTFVKRGGASVVTVDDDDLAARPDSDEAPALLQTVRTQEAELPRRVYVEYVNADFDYQTGTQYEERQVTASQTDTTVSLPINLSDQTAKGIAGAHVWGAYQEREVFTWWTSRKYAKYVPTDVMTVSGMTLRVLTAQERANNTIEWTGVVSRSELYDIPASVTGVASSAPGQVTPAANVTTEAVLLDIPILSQNDAPFGFYAALGPSQDGPWPGAALYKSIDGGSSYAAVKSASVPSIIGVVAEALDSASGSPTSTLTVTLTDDDAELSSCNATALANGANLFALESGSGWEFCQFLNATLTAPKTYSITVDVRGARDTSAYQSGHAAGDTFVLLSTVYNVDAPESELNQALWYKAVTFGNALADAVAFQFTNTGVATETFYNEELENLDTFVGDIGSPDVPKKGLVPAPAVGDCSAGKFLSACGDWEVPAGTGGGSPAAGGAIEVRDEGVTITSAASVLDFVGPTITASGGSTVTVAVDVLPLHLDDGGSPTGFGRVGVNIAPTYATFEADTGILGSADGAFNYQFFTQWNNGTNNSYFGWYAYRVTPGSSAATEGLFFQHYPGNSPAAFFGFYPASLSFGVTDADTAGVNNHGMVVSDDQASYALTPDPSAVFEARSTERGLLLPRMTTSQVNAIASPTDGLAVYDSTLTTIKHRLNGAWVPLAPVAARYIVHEAHADLTNELVLTAGYGITITEGGGSPPTSLTVAVDTGTIGSGSTSQAQEVTATGAFTVYVPAGVTAVRITAIGAGGGGSSRTGALGAGGGASGEQVMSFVAYFDGGSPNTITGEVGVGGPGAAAGGGAAAGTAGGDTIVYVSGQTIKARGGAGGLVGGAGGVGGGFRGGAGGSVANPGGTGTAGTAEAVTHFGGGGGGGGGSTTGANGGRGAPSGGYAGAAGGTAGGTQGGGGGGASSPYGDGGAGGNGGSAGTDATSYGSGGGGAGGLTGNNAKGGDGADGYVLIEYVAPA